MLLHGSQRVWACYSSEELLVNSEMPLFLLGFFMVQNKLSLEETYAAVLCGERVDLYL